MATPKRDSDYFLEKIRKKHPKLYDDILAGKLSVNKARQLAGMGGKRTWLSQLKNAWSKATPAERSQFLSWSGLVAPTPAPVPPASTPSGSAFDADGFMLEWARRRIPEIMQRRAMAFGDVADELTIKRLDPSVMNAVHNDTRIKSMATRAAIDAWLKANAAV